MKRGEVTPDNANGRAYILNLSSEKKSVDREGKTVKEEATSTSMRSSKAEKKGEKRTKVRPKRRV